MVKAIVGANWGDEGKGKITDMLAADSDIVIRFQGGANAGHTIINEYGKFALHLLPSGSFNQNVTNMIGNGVALDIPELIKEIDEVVKRGVPKPNIVVSERTQVLMPYHKLFDQYEEERLSDRQFGSTKSGIAPFFSDKFSKIGFQVWELFEPERLKEKIKNVIEVKNLMLEHIYHKPLLDADELLNTLMEYADMIKPYLIDSVAFMHNAIKEGKKILLEGQLGSLKDPDFGIYPMTTSSSTLAGYGAVGAGIPPYEITDIVTVVKAYSSAVGAGAFVSEIFGEDAAVTAVNSVLQQADRDVWVGSTVLRHVTAVVYRVQLKLHLLYLTYLVILMKFLYVWDMKLTVKLSEISLQQTSLKEQSLF